MKNLKLLIFFILFSVTLFGQNCYLRRGDFSGFNTDPYQAILENASCQLLQELPEEFRSDFKVYDYDFYILNEYMQGEFQSTWDQIISNVKLESSYYLLIGKQSDNTGIYTKFWVDVNLPVEGLFSCMSEFQRISLIHKIEKTIRNYYLDNNNTLSEYANAEVEGIGVLKNLIIDLKNCCQPTNRSVCSQCEKEMISDYLDGEGFTGYSIEASTIGLGQINSFEDENIKDVSGLKVKIKGSEVILGEYLNSFIGSLSQYIDVGLLVSSNNNFCLYSKHEMDSFSQGHEFNYWVHIQEDESVSSNFSLRVKIISNNINFDHDVSFGLIGFLQEYLDISDVSFTTGNDLETEIGSFFENIIFNNSLTPQNIADDLWNYQPKIDMNKAPESSPKNTLGVARNKNFFFKERLKLPDLSMWSQENRIRINAGQAPLVDNTWLSKNPGHAQWQFELENNGSIKLDNQNQPIRQKLIHHHVEHGRYAVAIPEGAHRQYYKYIHYITRKEKNFTKGQKLHVIKNKINALNRGLGVCGLFLNAAGFATGNPGNIVNWFGNAQIGKLKFDPISNWYALFYNEAIFENPHQSGFHKDWKRCAWWKVYISYAWSEDEGKYVGIGLGAEGYVYTLKNNKTKVIIKECYIDDHPSCVEFNLYRG